MCLYPSSYNFNLKLQVLAQIAKATTIKNPSTTIIPKSTTIIHRSTTINNLGGGHNSRPKPVNLKMC